jgi:hypothetical protein
VKGGGREGGWRRIKGEVEIEIEFDSGIELTGG